MAEPRGALVTPVGFDPSGYPLALEVDANGYLKVAIASWLEGAVDVKGYTGAAWVPLLVNASGQAIVVGKGTSEEVNAALLAPARALVGPHGWIGSAWQKQPINIGYSGRVKERFSAASGAGGDTIALSTAVPAGEIHVVNFVAAYHDDPTARDLVFYANDGTLNYELAAFPASAQYAVKVQPVEFAIAPGDKLRVVCFSMAGSKNVQCSYWGRRVDIDQ
jgi:hypothetical protein